MKPRSSEVKALVAVLEEDHEDAEACASAVFNTVVGLLRLRDAYGARIETIGGIRAVFAGFTVPTAEKAIKPWGGTKADLYPLVRSSFLDVTDPAGSIEDRCRECGHSWMAHEFPDRADHSGCVAGLIRDQKVKNKLAPILRPGCGCQEKRGK